MKVKNVKPIERHVEKIVLAVAGAVLLGLLYSAYSITPTVSSGNEVLGPGEVEGQVTKSAQKLRDDLLTREANLQLNTRGPNYVEQLVSKREKPIPDNLLAPVPKFAPEQVALAGAGGALADNSSQQKVDLKVPAPVDVATSSSRGTMLVPPEHAAADQPRTRTPLDLTTSEGVPTDLSWVKVEASYPLADLRKSIDTLPDQLRRITFYRVVAQRQKLTGKTWSEWQDVTPANPERLEDIKLGAPAQLESDLNTLDNEATAILEPEFYQPVKEKTELTASQNPTELNTRRPNIRGGAGGPPPNIEAMVAAMQAAAAARAGAMGDQGPAPTFRPNQPAVTPDLLKGDTVKIWLYDTSVEPGARYRYRLAVKIYNPLYGTRGQAWLTSPWSEPSEPVRVSPTLQFFAVQGIGAGPITLEVYRWASGKWAKLEQGSKPGLEVGQERYSQEVKGPVDFRTGNYVVDSQPFTQLASLVVLSDDKGNLFLRDATVDESSADRKQIMKDSAPPKPTTQPAATNNPANNPLNPITPARPALRNFPRTPRPRGN